MAQRIPATELKLADVVQLDGFFGGWGTAIVKQIKDGLITFWRPYGHSGEFEYSGGVICYIGLEEFSVFVDSNRTYNVVERKRLA